MNESIIKVKIAEKSMWLALSDERILGVLTHFPLNNTPRYE